MVKTLRITSILVALLACAVIILPVAFGSGKDPQIERLLELPGVVENFNNANATRSIDRGQSSPLVKQAEAFALYLNPPVKPQLPAVARTNAYHPYEPPRPRGPISVKFRLLGTCYNASDPQQSLAFIDEPGKGQHWIRQGNVVGHLTIQDIQDGLVICNNAGRIEQVAVEPKQEPISLLQGAPRPSRAGNSYNSAISPVENAIASRHSSVRTSAMAQANERARANLQRRPSSRIVSDPTVEDSMGVQESEPLDANRTAEIDSFVDRLRNLQEGFKADKTGQSKTQQEKAAMMEKLLREYRNTRVDTNEARRLGNLGKRLNSDQLDPNVD